MHDMLASYVNVNKSYNDEAIAIESLQMFFDTVVTHAQPSDCALHKIVPALKKRIISKL